MRLLVILFSVFVLTAMAGCEPVEVLGRVEGRVTYVGEPVANACILFENQTKGVFIIATLDNDGKYVVTMDKGYGLPLGEYAVSISPPPPDAPEFASLEGPKPQRDIFPQIPEKYRNKKTSGLKLVVQEGINRFDVAMEAAEVEE